MKLSRVMFAGFGGALLSAACNHAPKEAPKPPDPAIHVETAVAEERPVPELVTITGTLDADQRTDLAANASGRVKKTSVERGQHVKAGDVIAELDARTAVLSATEAQANAVSARDQLTLNRADCARYAVLLSQHAITQQEFDRAATQCRTQESAEQAASARAAQASKVVGDSTIRAPFAGVVSERFVNVGDYVKDDSKVATVLVDNPLRLRLTVPEANIAAAHAGVVVTFDSVALNGQAFSATIRYVGREIRENSRDFGGGSHCRQQRGAARAGHVRDRAFADGHPRRASHPAQSRDRQRQRAQRVRGRRQSPRAARRADGRRARG